MRPKVSVHSIGCYCRYRSMNLSLIVPRYASTPTQFNTFDNNNLCHKGKGRQGRGCLLVAIIIACSPFCLPASLLFSLFFPACHHPYCLLHSSACHHPYFLLYSSACYHPHCLSYSLPPRYRLLYSSGRQYLYISYTLLPAAILTSCYTVLPATIPTACHTVCRRDTACYTVLAASIF
jgi:hypothetical protein